MRIIKISGFVLLVLMTFSCSLFQGGKAAGPEVMVEDAELQATIDDLRQKISKNPDVSEFRLQLATIYMENGYNTQALQVLEEGLKRNPEDSELKYHYGEVALRMGDKVRGYTAFKSVLESVDGPDYLDRISPHFVDAFKVTKVVGTEANEAFGSFSPDGQKIVYQTDVNGNWDIYVYDLSTGKSSPLIESPAQEENPCLSPDGLSIAYTSTEDDHREVPFDQKLRDIYVMELSSGKKKNLTRNGSDDWRPRYSFSGKYIAFVSQRNDLRDVPFYQLTSDVFVMQSSGRFQLSLTHDDQSNDGNPCLMPGATDEEGKILFDSDRSGSYAIYKMDIQTREIQQLTFNPGINDVGPAISPSGEKIAFFSDRDGNFEIYMMNDDGSAQQRVTSNPAEDAYPSFSPDGNKILFHSNRNGNYDLFLVDLSERTEQMPIGAIISRIDEALSNLAQ